MVTDEIVFKTAIIYGDAGRLYARALKVMTIQMTNDGNQAIVTIFIVTVLTAMARVTLV